MDPQVLQDLSARHCRPQKPPDLCALRCAGLLMASPVGKGSAWASRAAQILHLELLADHDLLRFPPGMR